MTRTTATEESATGGRVGTAVRAGAGRLARLLLALLLAHGLWLLGAATAGAEGPEQDGAAATVPTMLVLDASGSMAATDGDSQGSTRMEVAKHAADDLVDALPEGSQLGLEVYGARTGNTAADKEKGCKDVEVVAPVGSSDAKALHAGIDGVEASGYTPIGTALRTAANNLPDTGERSIVLVSDGIDSCAPPDACQVAKELKAQGTDLAVHAIGFRVDEDARKSLSCIAEATGGTYTDVTDGDQLSAQLAVKATRALQGYQVDGSAVTGGASTAEAPTIDAGAYLDTFEHGSTEDLGDGLTKYYRIPVGDGERVHASAAVIPPPGDEGFTTTDGASHVLFLKTTIVDADGQECFFRSDMNVGAVVTSESPVRAYADSAPVGSATGCTAEDGALYLAVERSGAHLTDQPLPVEIHVGIQQQDTTSAPAAPAASELPAVTEKEGAATEVELGRSAAQAPDLGPGTYRISMVPGDVGMVGVKAEQGQRLSWHLSTEKAATYDGDQVGNVASVSMLMLNPLQQPVADESSNPVTEMVVSEDPQYAETHGMATPIDPANVEDPAATGASPWLGGEQHLQLAMGTGAGSASDSSEPSTFLLTIQVDGTAQKSSMSLRTTAAHDDLPAVTDQDVQAADGAGAASDGGGAEAAASDGGSSSGGSSDAAAQADGSGSGRTALVVGAAGAGVVALAALAAAAVVLVRRRR